MALAEAGADVALAARSKAALEETAELAMRAGRRAVVVPTDVSSYGEVDALIQRTVHELGRLDIVVNNSGVAKVAPLAELTPEDWRFMVDVNLTGVFNGCRAAAPHLIAQRSGKVINVASVLGQVGLPGYTVYGATKGGIIALTRSLGVEWARHNVQVNAIAPGWFATDMTHEAFANPRINERLTRDIPVGRFGQDGDLDGALLLLVSDAGSYIAGATIVCDGGQMVALRG